MHLIHLTYQTAQLSLAYCLGPSSGTLTEEQRVGDLGRKTSIWLTTQNQGTSNGTR